MPLQVDHYNLLPPVSESHGPFTTALGGSSEVTARLLKLQSEFSPSFTYVHHCILFIYLFIY